MLFDEYRKNLVECQLAPNGIANPEIINIFRTMPREIFYSTAQASACYGDEDLRTSDHSWSLEPLTEARILNHGGFKKEDVVLLVGATTPTLPAYLAQLVTTVIVIDTDEDLLENIRKATLQLELCNIVFEKVQNYNEGFSEQAPYDKIIFAGAISKVPDIYASQLVAQGALIAVERATADSPGYLNLYTKTKDNYISKKFIEHANTPYLQGFKQESHFVF